MVKSILILHLSDLHFGPNSRFAELKPENLGQKLCIAVEDECNRRNIDEKISLVIITGDIAENARSEEYDLARSFFENLAIKLKIDHNNFIFVPGNHDVNWIACKRVELDQEEQKFSNEEFAARINLIKFKNFEIFVEDFYGISLEDKGHPINYGSYIYNINNLKLSIAALNSSERESHRKEDHMGFLSDNHAQSLMNEWYGDRFDSWLKIIAIHHNPVPTVPENVMQGITYLENLDKKGLLKNIDVQRFASDAVGFTGRDKLRNVSRQCHVQLILHGHHHVVEQETWPWQRDGISHILSAGSWGLKELPKDQENNLQLILLKPEEKQLHAWTLVSRQLCNVG
jgi:3',5'-cyclic AMP phosphodiesterase CpdA